MSLRNKIAAGEVVERPSSIVKELIENSIDAGGGRISVETARAGKRLIKVADNGSGMEREDALLAFERYATSKIRDEEDLFDIRTMGFRGEALSSIAAVAKVRLTTAPAAVAGGNGPGTCIEIAGGEMRDVKDCAASGTSVEVKDLFFNTPARRKFLKSDTTENYHIIDAVTREALSHYLIGFSLLMDGSEVLTLPAASSYRERLLQVYGKESLDAMVETDIREGRMGLKAFVGRPSNLRSNKNGQFLFINRRPVRDQSVAFAVSRAYEDLLPRDRHPVFFIFLEIDPAEVDFNVHPAKREVRFGNKSAVFNFVYNAARDVLRQVREEGVRASGLGSRDEERPSYDAGMQESGRPVAQEHGIFPSPGAVVSEPAHPRYFTGSIPFIYLGDTFVAVPDNRGIIIMDYHAAHERINYERFLKKIDVHSCPLLFPQQVKLESGDYRVILENLDLLREMGVDAEDFGHNTIIVRGLPESLRDADLNALMADAASSLLSGDSVVAESGGSEKGLGPLNAGKRALAARLACHSSIRGREVPDGPRISELMKDLDSAENPDSCPHGRPTRIFISLEELRKMFRK